MVASGMGAAGLLFRPFNALSRDAPRFRGIAPFQIDGDSLVVPVARYRVPGWSISMTTSARLQIDPADVVTVRDEELLLADTMPSGVFNGTMLKGTKAYTIGAFHSLIEESLTLRDGSGRLLRKGDDYRVSANFAL